MYRILAVIFSLTIITISIAGMVQPDGVLSIVINTSTNAAVGRIVFSLLLVMYSLFPSLRYGITRTSLFAASLGLIVFVLVSVGSDGASLPQPMDVFFGLQGFVITVVALLDFTRPLHAQKFAPELLYAKLRKIEMPVPALPIQSKAA